ncbi:MAG TPA: proton-conducting transporter membrane subunit, partial [Armatimonadota bacterium]|nr:proton-conducting transporter membrane subunit [Armatimonadota bacterium]
IAFLAGGPAGAIAATFYLTAYLPALLGIFTLLTALSGRERDADAIADYAGLAWRRPVLAAAFTVLLLSLAGIPLTGGFIGKFYVALTGVSAALAGSPAFWALVGALVVGSVIGLYYYLRIVLAFFQRTPAGEEPAAITRRVPDAAAIVLTLSTLAVLWLGVLPGNTLTLISLLVEEWFR